MVQQDCVLILDKYPKFRLHALVIARDLSLGQPTDLTADHLPLLQAMEVLRSSASLLYLSGFPQVTLQLLSLADAADYTICHSLSCVRPCLDCMKPGWICMRHQAVPNYCLPWLLRTHHGAAAVPNLVACVTWFCAFRTWAVHGCSGEALSEMGSTRWAST